MDQDDVKRLETVASAIDGLLDNIPEEGRRYVPEESLDRLARDIRIIAWKYGERRAGS